MTRRSTPLALVAGLMLLSIPLVSQARPASVGYYTEAGVGATTFVGAAASYSRIGPGFELRAGYELFPWLATGLYLSGSIHEATVPPPPEDEYFQLYSAAADVRIGVPLGRWGLFAEGGVGLGMVSSNVLARVDILEPGERLSFLYRAGAGMEYQLQNRHYAFGLAGQWVAMPGFDQMQGISSRIYLRYTY